MLKLEIASLKIGKCKDHHIVGGQLVPSLKLTANDSEKSGWEDEFSFWVSAYFQWFLLLVSGVHTLSPNISGT